MKKHTQGFIVPLLLVIIVVLVAGGGYYVYSQKKSSVTKNIPASKEALFDDSLLKITQAEIPPAQNSVATLNAVDVGKMDAQDIKYLNTYFNSFSTKKLPPLAESQKIVAKYTSLLKTYDTVASLPYQCSLDRGETCYLQPIRVLSNLAALRSLVSFGQNKINAAHSDAQSIVLFGKNITAHADSMITLLVGWSTQKNGYSLLSHFKPKLKVPLLSSEGKSQNIAALRNEHKKVLRYMYTRHAEVVDYLTSSANVPSISFDEETKKIIDETFRPAINERTWNPIETKQYFYDSFVLSLRNVDSPCGSTLASTTLTLNFDPKDATTENYVGKTLYTSAYASLETINAKRCEVEEQINSL